MAATPELVVDCRGALLENPLWEPETGLVWFLDLLGPAIHRYDPLRNRHERFALDGSKPLGCLVRGPGEGSFLLARREGIFRLDPDSLETAFWTDPNARFIDTACNDGKIGPDGALWLCVDDLAEQEPRGVLWRVAPDGSAAVIDAGFAVGNGPAFAPDGRTMYFADSMGARILAYDLVPELGEVRSRRVFATLGGEAGFPDGMTVDEEGHLWVAHWGGSRVSRYAPDGGVERVIPLPVPNVTSVAFAGADLTTLYITTAREGMTQEQLETAPQAGGLYRLEIGIRGRPEPAMPA
ncbi:MAG: SMP-30/gluconolactonase/LRE family protein [Geminicoccaceae bacterium]